MDLKTSPGNPLLSLQDDRRYNSQNISHQVLGDRSKQGNYGSQNPMAKVEISTTRPCAVIEPDRIIPQPAHKNDNFLPAPPVETWSCPDTNYLKYAFQPLKHPTDSRLPPRNISPRQTFQENMQRFMTQPRNDGVKGIEPAPSMIAHSTDKNSTSAKNIRINSTTDTKFCEVPYLVNAIPGDQRTRILRNGELYTNSISQGMFQPQGHWSPASGVQVNPYNPYGPPDPRYQDYTNCSVPRAAVVTHTQRGPTEDPAAYSESYYRGGDVRYDPYPATKDRFPRTRYNYLNNYPNQCYYPPPKYDIQKTMGLPGYVGYPHSPYKYPDPRMVEYGSDAYVRQHQYPNFTDPVSSKYSQSPVNIQNKVCSYPIDANQSSNIKIPFNPNRVHSDYDNSRFKVPAQEPPYLPADMQHFQLKPQMPMQPHLNNDNIKPPPYGYYYRNDGPMFRNISAAYASRYKNLEQSQYSHNPLTKIPIQFSPNIISPSGSNTSNESMPIQNISHEDFGYVSQCSSLSGKSIDLPNPYNNEVYRKLDHHHLNRSTLNINRSCDNKARPANKTLKDKSIDVRQYLQMWDEEFEEVASIHKAPALENENKTNTSKQEQLYVLGMVNVSAEELTKYENVQKVSKLPENIKGYDNVELLRQFDAVFGPTGSINKQEYEQKKSKELPPVITDRPVSPLDVEAKISQSVIHKEVGCNFEIKPCSPSKLEVTCPQLPLAIVGERKIERVLNTHGSIMKSNLDNKKTMDKRKHSPSLDDVTIPKIQRVNDCKVVQPVSHEYNSKDYESVSSVCLESLPRLDAEVDLNFQEVNQQFINAQNHCDSVILNGKSNTTNHTVPSSGNNLGSIGLSMMLDTWNSQELKEKYDNVKPSTETTDALLVNAFQRTDSVIIKNHIENYTPGTNENLTNKKTNESQNKDPNVKLNQSQLPKPTPYNESLNHATVLPINLTSDSTPCTNSNTLPGSCSLFTKNKAKLGSLPDPFSDAISINVAINLSIHSNNPDVYSNTEFNSNCPLQLSSGKLGKSLDHPFNNKFIDSNPKESAEEIFKSSTVPIEAQPANLCLVESKTENSISVESELENPISIEASILKEVTAEHKDNSSDTTFFNLEGHDINSLDREKNHEYESSETKHSEQDSKTTFGVTKDIINQSFTDSDVLHQEDNSKSRDIINKTNECIPCSHSQQSKIYLYNSECSFSRFIMKKNTQHSENLIKIDSGIDARDTLYSPEIKYAMHSKRKITSRNSKSLTKHSSNTDFPNKSASNTPRSVECIFDSASGKIILKTGRKISSNLNQAHNTHSSSKFYESNSTNASFTDSAQDNECINSVRDFNNKSSIREINETKNIDDIIASILPVSPEKENKGYQEAQDLVDQVSEKANIKSLLDENSIEVGSESKDQLSENNNLDMEENVTSSMCSDMAWQCLDKFETSVFVTQNQSIDRNVKKPSAASIIKCEEIDQKPTFEDEYETVQAISDFMKKCDQEDRLKVELLSDPENTDFDSNEKNNSLNLNMNSVDEKYYDIPLQQADEECKHADSNLLTNDVVDNNYCNTFVTEKLDLSMKSAYADIKLIKNDKNTQDPIHLNSNNDSAFDFDTKETEILQKKINFKPKNKSKKLRKYINNSKKLKSDTFHIIKENVGHLRLKLSLHTLKRTRNKKKTERKTTNSLNQDHKNTHHSVGTCCKQEYNTNDYEKDSEVIPVNNVPLHKEKCAITDATKFKDSFFVSLCDSNDEFENENTKENTKYDDENNKSCYKIFQNNKKPQENTNDICHKCDIKIKDESFDRDGQVAKKLKTELDYCDYIKGPRNHTSEDKFSQYSNEPDLDNNAILKLKDKPSEICSPVTVRKKFESMHHEKLQLSKTPPLNLEINSTEVLNALSDSLVCNSIENDFSGVKNQDSVRISHHETPIFFEDTASEDILHKKSRSPNFTNDILQKTIDLSKEICNRNKINNELLTIDTVSIETEAKSEPSNCDLLLKRQETFITENKNNFHSFDLMDTFTENLCKENIVDCDLSDYKFELQETLELKNLNNKEESTLTTVQEKRDYSIDSKLTRVSNDDNFYESIGSCSAILDSKTEESQLTPKDGKHCNMLNSKVFSNSQTSLKEIKKNDFKNKVENLEIIKSELSPDDLTKNDFFDVNFDGFDYNNKTKFVKHQNKNQVSICDSLEQDQKKIQISVSDDLEQGQKKNQGSISDGLDELILNRINLQTKSNHHSSIVHDMKINEASKQATYFDKEYISDYTETDNDSNADTYKFDDSKKLDVQAGNDNSLEKLAHDYPSPVEYINSDCDNISKKSDFDESNQQENKFKIDSEEALDEMEQNCSLDTSPFTEQLFEKCNMSTLTPLVHDYPSPVYEFPSKSSVSCSLDDLHHQTIANNFFQEVWDSMLSKTESSNKKEAATESNFELVNKNIFTLHYDDDSNTMKNNNTKLLGNSNVDIMFSNYNLKVSKTSELCTDHSALTNQSKNHQPDLSAHAQLNNDKYSRDLNENNKPIKEIKENVNNSLSSKVVRESGNWFEDNLAACIPNERNSEKGEDTQLFKESIKSPDIDTETTLSATKLNLLPKSHNMLVYCNTVQKDDVLFSENNAKKARKKYCSRQTKNDSSMDADIAILEGQNDKSVKSLTKDTNENVEKEEFACIFNEFAESNKILTAKIDADDMDVKQSYTELICTRNKEVNTDIQKQDNIDKGLEKIENSAVAFSAPNVSSKIDFENNIFLEKTEYHFDKTLPTIGKSKSISSPSNLKVLQINKCKIIDKVDDSNGIETENSSIFEESKQQNQEITGNGLMESNNDKEFTELESSILDGLTDLSKCEVNYIEHSKICNNPTQSAILLNMETVNTNDEETFESEFIMADAVEIHESTDAIITDGLCLLYQDDSDVFLSTEIVTNTVELNHQENDINEPCENVTSSDMWIDDVACVETVVTEGFNEESNDCIIPTETKNFDQSEQLDDPDLNFPQRLSFENIELQKSIVNLELSKKIYKSFDNNSTLCEKYSSECISSEHRKTTDQMLEKFTLDTSESSSSSGNSAILLKLTKSKTSPCLVFESNKDSSVNGIPGLRCKFTEKSHYTSNLISGSRISENGTIKPLITKGAQKYIPPLDISPDDLKVRLELPKEMLEQLKHRKEKKASLPQATYSILKQKHDIMKQKKTKPKFEDVLKNIDVVHRKLLSNNKYKRKFQNLPKMVIKRNDHNVPYTSQQTDSSPCERSPDLTGSKWQPWIFLEKNMFIERMVLEKRTSAIYCFEKQKLFLPEQIKSRRKSVPILIKSKNDRAGCKESSQQFFKSKEILKRTLSRSKSSSFSHRSI